jgi:prefoldin subunit 5
MASYDRDIGRLEAVAQSLERQIEDLKVERDELKKDLKKLGDELAQIRELVAQIRGGSRVVLWVGAMVSGGIGTALVKFAPLLMSLR